MTLRVGVNGRAFVSPEPDGAVQASINLINKLNEINDIDVVCYLPCHNQTELISDNIEVKASSGIKSQFYGVVWERTVLPMLVQGDNLDVLFCPNGNAPLTKIPGIDIVTLIHDVNALKGLSSGIHYYYRRATVPISAKVSDSIVTISQFSKREIADEIGIDSSKIEVVYNGLNEEYLNSDKGEPWQVPDKYILYVGAMNPRKNIQGVIRSFEIFSEKRETSHKLVLIGPQNKLIYSNFDVDESDNILTPGFIPQSQLKYAYCNADAFIYPSYYEGFGLPPVEAMACGTPVIASNTSSLPEILGDHAMLADPDNHEKMASMIELCVENDHSTHTAKEWARNYTWEKSARKLAGILRNYGEI